MGVLLSWSEVSSKVSSVTRLPLCCLCPTSYVVLRPPGPIKSSSPKCNKQGQERDFRKNKKSEKTGKGLLGSGKSDLLSSTVPE
jgi:hypothetical protein